MITTSDIHWVAGFLEGEGSFYDAKGNPTIQAAQVQKWPLIRLSNSLKGSFYLVQRKKKNPKHNDIWYWTLAGVNAAAWMMTLYTLLSPRRQEQIKKALNSWKQHLPRPEHRTHCPHGHEYSIENTFARPGKPHRECRTCQRRRSLAAKKKKNTCPKTKS